MTPTRSTLADVVEQLAADASTPLERAALTLVDAINRETRGQYQPAGWIYTGHYGSCANCTEYLRGCGVPTPAGQPRGIAVDPLILCPDCAGITRWPAMWAEALAAADLKPRVGLAGI